MLDAKKRYWKAETFNKCSWCLFKVDLAESAFIQTQRLFVVQRLENK